MYRRDFIEKTLIGSLALAGYSVLNEGFMLVGAFGERSGSPIRGNRIRENIDANWRFHIGDEPNAEQPSYDDHAWHILDLPHDWSIEGEMNKDTGLYPGGIGWYRKGIPWIASWQGRKVYVDFDGVYMNSDVWINGHHLGHRPYGYISFRYDITPYLTQGNNVIAVRADNSKLPSARWYTGSGIYRHVWLNVANQVHVGHWGTFVNTPEVSADNAVVDIQTQVVNDSDKDKLLDIEQGIYSYAGRLVANTHNRISTKAGSENKLQQTLKIRYPLLWSPDNPNLYEVRTVVKENARILDQYHTPLGIRKIEFNPKWGFRLNGEPLIFKGTCNHDESDGIVGAAVPDDVLYWRLMKLKEMGSNAIRTSHNPRSPEFYAFCDVLGLMVMDEAFDGWDTPKAKYDYGLYFTKWWKTDMESFIRRDRNHPCVVMWSIGNEVKGYSDARQKEMVDFVHNLDNTRPVTQSSHVLGPYTDIVGFNGQGEEKGMLEAYHKKYPDRPMIGTEMTHTLQTRGVYRTQTQYRLRDFPAPWDRKGSWNAFKDNVYMIPDLSKEEVFTDVPEIYKSSYDNCLVRIDVRDQFKHDSRYPYLMGSFRWSGFDYLGEALNPGIRTSNFGIIDLAGFPKDHYYLYQSLWTRKPMVHILPHWTHPGKEGVKIPVVVYSNCERLELYFNGKSLGEQTMGDDLQLVWQVPYESGMLLAVASNGNGLRLAETVQQTAGEAYSLRLESNRAKMRSNRQDVARLEVSVVDKNGVIVPHASNLVYFKIKESGRL